MALIRSSVVRNLTAKHRGILFTAVRHHWNKDYKPGPFPVTPEQRAAAAKKYGLTPEEYKVYPDDGRGIGDYPNLPMVSADSKDPFYPWDYPTLRRNFNETMHAEADFIGEDRYDVSFRPRIPGYLQVLAFVGFIGTGVIIFFLLEPMKFFHGLSEKQYPNSGKKNYTFEPKS